MKARSITWAVSLFIVLMILWALLTPPLSTPRAHIYRSIRRESQRQIMDALHAYHDEHKHLPQSSIDGQGLLGWRVELLPYLGEQELYDQIDKTVSWDHKNNQPFHDQMPTVFEEPAHRDKSSTPFIGVAGEGTAWTNGEPTRLLDIHDGSSNSVALVVLPENRANWMAPDSVTMDQYVSIIRQAKLESVTVSLWDGSVDQLLVPQDLKKLKYVFLIDDGRDAWDWQK